MTTPWKRIIAMGFILGIVGLVMLALLPKPISVVVTPAEWGPLQVTVDEEGETRIRDRFTVAAPVSGRLLRIALRDGDPVALNQVVAEVWPLPLSAREREEQKARVLAAEALQRQAEEQVRRAQTDYEQARRERERIEPDLPGEQRQCATDKGGQRKPASTLQECRRSPPPKRSEQKKGRFCQRNREERLQQNAQ